MSRRKEIEQAAMQVGGVHPDWDVLECFRVGFKEGAKWADKTMLEKACEWLYVYYPTLERAKSFEDAWEHFKKAMED